MQYSELAVALMNDSIRRLAIDAERGFEFLRTVPSSRTKLFVDYWTEKKDARMWSDYLRLLSRLELGQNADALMPNGWSEFSQQRLAQWKYRPFSVRRTLGLLLTQAGKLPPHMRSTDVTDEQVRAYASIEWPSEKKIVAACARQFEIKLADDQGDSREYIVTIGQKGSRWKTKLVVVPEVCAITYYHEIQGVSRPFVLADHAASWSPINWDLITLDNLGAAVDVLCKIVDDLERRIA
jgi:hypothetical protein